MEENEVEKMSLVNIKGGAIVESFDACLQDVLDNINDINTSEKERTISLKVKFKPIEGRSLVVGEYSCETKLQRHDAIKFAADLKIDPDRRRGFAIERGASKQQQPLPFKPRIMDGKD